MFFTLWRKMNYWHRWCGSPLECALHLCPLTSCRPWLLSHIVSLWPVCLPNQPHLQLVCQSALHKSLRLWLTQCQIVLCSNSSLSSVFFFPACLPARFRSCLFLTCLSFLTPGKPACLPSPTMSMCFLSSRCRLCTRPLNIASDNAGKCENSVRLITNNLKLVKLNGK